MKLIISNYNYSTWSMVAWLFVHRHELPVEVKCYDMNSDEFNQELSKRLSGNKVPFLLDGDTEVWDSLAILEYLGERFPDSHAWPKDRKARAVARSVCAEFHSSFEALRTEAPMNLRKRFPGYTLSEAALADVRRIQELWRYCREHFGEGGPWLFGKPTVADTLSAPALMRFRSVEVELDETAADYRRTMDKCPSIREWIGLALKETHRVEQNELDWPSEAVTAI